MEIRHYVAQNGLDPIQDWMDALKDVAGRVTILRRIDRLTTGNFGDHKFCRDGVWELRIDFGPGYRVHYALARFSTAAEMKRKTSAPASRSHEAATVESFRNDPQFAAAYLDAVLLDGTQEELMLALRRLSEAFGGVRKLASNAKLNTTTLYRTLSPTGNPELRSMNALLKAMGMRLSVQPLKKTGRKRAA